MMLAVASGKGGTGKTTVALNLAKVVACPVQVLDCDVEEPNAHLFLRGTLNKRETITKPVPVVDRALCDACGECSRFCQYHAIVCLKDRVMVFAEMCHSCGGCAKVCPRQAISETGQRIGVVETIVDGLITLVTGRLDVGVAMAPPLVHAVKSRICADKPAIIDAPPGTSCPVIASVKGADFVALVTEPTPFGLHDLRLAVDMVRQLAIPFGVVINRVGVGDDRVHDYCGQQRTPILLEIPDDRRIAEAYSRGDLVVDALPEYRRHFERLADATVRQGGLARRPGAADGGRPE
ncbi:MAG: ATP-binding protein [bacterium]